MLPELIDDLALDAHERCIVRHLLDSLSADAVEAWVESSPPRKANQGVHEVLHSGLSRTRKILRRRRPGIPVHAAAAALSDEVGVMAVGRTSSGKSTLITALGVHLGASIVGDDTVWYRARTVSDIGAPIAIRSGSPFWARVQRLWYAEDGARIMVSPEDIGAPAPSTQASISVVVFPQFEPNRCDLEALRPVDALCEMGASLLRPVNDDEFLALGELVAAGAPARLSYGDVASSIRLMEQVLDRASHVPVPEVVFVDQCEQSRVGCRPGVRVLRLGDDAAVWDSARGTLVSVHNWSSGMSVRSPAWNELRSLGLVDDQLVTDD